MLVISTCVTQNIVTIKQLTPYSEQLIKILMKMCSFIQNIGLLSCFDHPKKINTALWRFQGNPLIIDQDIDENV